MTICLPYPCITEFLPSLASYERAQPSESHRRDQLRASYEHPSAKAVQLEYLGGSHYSGHGSSYSSAWGEANHPSCLSGILRGFLLMGLLSVSM